MKMPSNSKGTKSRTGCTNCKTRRIKCDETKPACIQCVQKRLECSGYAQRLKWSSKYEKYKVHSTRPPSAENSSKREPGFDQIVTKTVSPQAQSSPIGNEGAELQDQVEEIVDVTTCDGLRETTISRFEKVALPHPSVSGSDLGRNGRKPAQWEPPDIVYSNPLFPVDFYFGHLCKHLCAWDSQHNPFRLATSSRMKSSIQFYCLSRYLAAAYLSPSNQVGSNNLVVRNAEKDVLHWLQSEISELRSAERSKRNDLLLAVIMYGLAGSWDGHNDSNIMHYNAAVSLFNAGSAIEPPLGSKFDTRQFFRGALLYWWMGLCFTTDRANEYLADPPAPVLDAKGRSPAAGSMPHPLIGVAADACLLLGKVGSLIYTRRVSAHHCSFTSVDNIMREYAAIEEAKSLEEELLSLKAPLKEDLFDIEDPDTPIDDLINMSEVYRLSALILLYRSFPDLLRTRFSPIIEQDQLQPCHSIEERRQQWITALAVHVLELLGRNHANSGTRSIEQLPLVIIAGELCKPQNIAVQKKVCLSLELYPLLEAEINYLETCTQEPTAEGEESSETVAYSEIIPMHKEAEDDWNFSVNVDEESIQTARNTVLRRLESIRRILPYRSIALLEELVFEIWHRNGRGASSFWIDIMIEKGWRFLLV